MKRQNKILKDFRKLHLLYEEGAIFTAFDTETTGLSPTNCRIIEIGAIKFSKEGIIQKYSQLFNPQCEIPYFISQLTHINQDMVNCCKTINCHLPDFLEMINNTILIAHNAQFDLNFLNAECEKSGLESTKNKVIDTLQYSK
mgnify:FL=1